MKRRVNEMNMQSEGKSADAETEYLYGTSEQLILAAEMTDQLDIRVEYIGPGRARSYLATSPGNRSIRPLDVARHIDALKNGTFVLTHQGIAFDENGNLSDGHHRLTGISKSGIGAYLMVTRNLDRMKTWHAMDRGAIRSLTDQTHGHKDGPVPKKVAETAICLVELANGSLAKQDAISLERLCRAIMPDYDERIPGGCVRSRSLAYMRTAMFMAGATFKPETVRKISADFIAGNFDVVPPSLVALNKYAEKVGFGGAARTTRLQASCMAYPAFFTAFSGKLKKTIDPIPEGHLKAIAKSRVEHYAPGLLSKLS